MLLLGRHGVYAVWPWLKGKMKSGNNARKWRFIVPIGHGRGITWSCSDIETQSQEIGNIRPKRA